MYQIRETKKLFYNKYPHKIVIYCPGVHKLRCHTLDEALDILTISDVKWRYQSLLSSKKETNDEIEESNSRFEYVKNVINTLKTFDDYKLRIEYYWLSIYVVDQSKVDQIINLDKSRVKYVCIPDIDLSPGEIVMADDRFDYRITISPSNSNHSSFVEWAENNKNIKVPNSSVSLLIRDHQYRQTYFYVKGDKQLSMVRLHLGSCIQRIEKIIAKNKLENL